MELTKSFEINPLETSDLFRLKMSLNFMPLFMNLFLSAVRANWLGFMLAITTPFMAVLCHGFVKAKHSTHMHQKAVEELGSILVFAGRPLPNHTATKLIFIQYRTNDAWGIYLTDISSGEKKLLDVLLTDTWREGVVYEQLRTLGWSADDRYFAYCRNRHRTIIICDTETGKQMATFVVNKPISTGVWLSAKSLVCSDGEGVFEFFQSNDQWFGPQHFGSFDVYDKNESAGKRIESLQAFSPTTLLWQQEGAIWAGTKKADPPARIWRPTTGELLEFSYSQDTKAFLLHFRDNHDHYFADLYPQTTSTQNALTNVERIVNMDYRPTQVHLINGGRGYAYLNESEFKINTPIVRAERHQPPTPLPWQGEIKGFAVSLKQLFVISSLTNEPVGIWNYDLGSQSLKSIVSNQEKPFKYATSQPTSQEVITNSSGKRLTYYLLKPSTFTTNRKPQLVLGVMGKLEKAYNWDRYAQTIANCGAYFAIADRRSSDEHEWANDVLTVYHALIKKFDVDTNSIYLLGISQGAGSVNALLERKPELWRGALYYSPGWLPDTKLLRCSRILIDIGSLDETWGENNIQAKDFRDAAARAGVNVTLFIRPGVGHNCRLLSIEKERLHRLAEFLGRS